MSLWQCYSQMSLWQCYSHARTEDETEMADVITESSDQLVSRARVFQ